MLPLPKSFQCRLCITETGKGIEIFSKKGIKLSIASIIAQHYPIKLTENDDRSKFICKHCWQTTEQFHQLYRNVQKIETEHWQNTANGKIDEPLLTPLSPYKVDIKEEFISHELDSEIENATYTEPKEESFLGTEYKFLEKDGTDDNSISIDPPDVEIFTDQKTDVKLIVKTRKIRKGVKPRNDKELTLKQQYLLEEHEIENALGMNCEICNEKTSTFLELKNHFRNQHEMNGYIKCCQTKFFRRGRLYNHIINHNDPDRYKCEQCGKVFVDPDRLRKHVKQHDLSRRKLQCSKCPKRFAAPSSLETHFQRVHQISSLPKTFFCDICGKSFISKMACSTHIHMLHTQKYRLICDICGKGYQTKSLLDYHYKTIHLNIVMPKIQCGICGSWLVNLTGLNKHMRLHTDKQETCSICGKITANKHALTGHIRYAHSNETFRCNICNKTLCSAKSLKEHNASHTGNYLYKCKYCPMEFNSNGNMYKHRKKLHPIECERDRDAQIHGSLKNKDN